MYLPLVSRLVKDVILHLLILVRDVLEIGNRKLLDGTYIYVSMTVFAEIQIYICVLGRPSP